MRNLNLKSNDSSSLLSLSREAKYLPRAQVYTLSGNNFSRAKFTLSREANIFPQLKFTLSGNKKIPKESVGSSNSENQGVDST